MDRLKETGNSILTVMGGMSDVIELRPSPHSRNSPHVEKLKMIAHLIRVHDVESLKIENEVLDIHHSLLALCTACSE